MYVRNKARWHPAAPGVASGFQRHLDIPEAPTVATIVVGIEDSLRGEDAVALASQLAQATGAEVLAVCAYPYDRDPAAHYNPTMEGALRGIAEATLSRLCDPLRAVAHVRTLAAADPVPARALLAVAQETDVIVVGSSHEGLSGRVLPGSTGHHLLQGAPCPIVLAPQGHRLLPPSRHGRVSVGFDGSPNAYAAVRAAARLAQSGGHRLRVVTVFDPACVTTEQMHVPPGYLVNEHDAERAAREALEHAVADIADVEPAFLKGDAAHELAHESQVSKWLVIGSRSYGPVPAVLLGDVGEAIVRTAECPVLVVPNGVADPLAALCGELRTDVAV